MDVVVTDRLARLQVAASGGGEGRRAWQACGLRQVWRHVGSGGCGDVQAAAGVAARTGAGAKPRTKAGTRAGARTRGRGHGGRDTETRTRRQGHGDKDTEAA